MKLGIIGYGKQAKQLIAHCDRQKFNITDINVFDRKENVLNFAEKNDCVFIASPSDSHAEYLTQLQHYDGYVLCEKPICQSNSQLHQIANLDLSKRAFVFPLIQTLPSKIYSMMNELETISSVLVEVTHGFAFRDEYRNSWRSSSLRQPLGVVEAATVHWIDLFVRVFGKSVNEYHNLQNVSHNGTAFDDCNTVIMHESGVVSKIHASYTSINRTLMTLIDNTGRTSSIKDDELLSYYTTGTGIIVENFLQNVAQKTHCDVVLMKNHLYATGLCFT